MRLLYDISALAVWHHDERAKRGIYRVVDDTLSALLEKCDLSLSSIENPYLGSLAVKARRGLSDITFLKNQTQEILCKIAFNLNGFHNSNMGDVYTNRNLVRKLSRFMTGTCSELSNRIIKMPYKVNYEDYDIFHQPGRLPFPSFAKNRNNCKPKRFMTVYDFIPFMKDGYAACGAPLLQSVFSTLSEDDYVICISSYVKSQACEMLNIPENNIFVAPLAASRELFYQCTNLEIIDSVKTKLGLNDSPYFLTLCALDTRKNIKRLLQAYADLCNQQSQMDAKLVLAGSVSDEASASIKQSLIELGIVDRVVLTGYVADEDLSALYTGAMAFVFPSLSEGFGLPPLEAMQCGAPVICSSATSLPEVIGDAGMLVDPLDSSAFSEAMWDLFSDSEKRAAYSRAGLERALQFSWEKCADDHITAYSQVI